jgi:hypothetical protein
MRWIEGITGQPYRRGAILSEKIGGAGLPDIALCAENLGVTLAYVLKGSEPEAAAAIGIEHEYGGRIIGKRCGMSRNLGAQLK